MDRTRLLLTRDANENLTTGLRREAGEGGEGQESPLC